MMTQCIINMIEIIQIDIQHGALATSTHRGMNLFDQIFLKTHPVIQAGEIVLIRLMFDFLLIMLRLRYIIDCRKTHLSAIHPVNPRERHFKPMIASLGMILM